MTRGKDARVDPTGPSRGDAGDRLTRLLSSRPYVTAGATTLLLLVMWNSGRDVFESDGEHGWLNWFVVAFALYALIVSLVVVPRWLAPKVSAEGHEGRLFVIGVAFAVAPFLVASRRPGQAATPGP